MYFSPKKFLCLIYILNFFVLTHELNMPLPVTGNKNNTHDGKDPKAIWISIKRELFIKP